MGAQRQRPRPPDPADSDGWADWRERHRQRTLSRRHNGRQTGADRRRQELDERIAQMVEDEFVRERAEQDRMDEHSAEQYRDYVLDLTWSCTPAGYGDDVVDFVRTELWHQLAELEH